MGMFDDVTCEMPLPDGFDGGGFQTKDFECVLDKYRITEDARLMRGGFSWDTDGVKTKREEVDVAYHGILNFYSCTGDHNDGTFVWHGYSAKFTDGKCVEITADG